MKIAIMTSRMIEEIKGLTEELRTRGHEVTLWPLDQIKPEMFVDGSLATELSRFDFVYYRSGFSDAGAFELGRLLEKTPSRLINRAVFRPLTSNKIHQAIASIKCGIAIPPTFIGRNVSFDTLNKEFGLPFILKAAHGIQGDKVFLIHDKDTYNKRLDEVSSEVIFQKFIPNGGDYRVFVLGGEVHDIFKRVAAEGNFKNNMALGARGVRVTDVTMRERLAAIGTTIAKSMEIEIGGIDIIESSEDGQLYFLEVNVNPGWRGLDSTLGGNTAAAVADYFERLLRSSNTTSL